MKPGRPWESGETFEASASAGPVHPVSEAGRLDQGRITLTANGELRQDEALNEMIWQVPEQIACPSERCELAAGDAMLSGTPSGVAAVEKGDVTEVSIKGLDTLTFTVV